MLKKYQNFKKIARSDGCCFYTGNILQNNQKVLIKRVKYKCTWNQVLKSQSIKIQSQQEYIPQMIQIFKSKQQYFIVYERPSGLNLGFFSQGIQKQLRDFYQIFSQFIQSLTKLSKLVADLYIYPQWLFMHRNSIKICHFEPYFQPSVNKKDAQKAQKQKNKGKNVYLYQMKKKFQQNNSIENNLVQQNGVRRIKNLNFNLGYLAYHLLTGKVTSWELNQQDFQSKVKEIQLNCRLRISTITKDQKLAILIEKLLKFQDNHLIDYFNTQLFKQFSYYIKTKNRSCCCKQKDRFRIVEFSLEKIKLQKKMSKIRDQKLKRNLRPCCSHLKNQQENPEQEKSPGKRFRIIQRRQRQNHTVQQRKLNKSLLPNMSQRLSQKKLNSPKHITSSNEYLINGQKINTSVTFPHLRTQRKFSLNQKLVRNPTRQMNSSNKFDQKKTSKKRLKTE